MALNKVTSRPAKKCPLLYSDIQGSTKISLHLKKKLRSDQGYIEILKNHHSILNRALSETTCRTLNFWGDGVLLTGKDAEDFLFLSFKVQMAMMSLHLYGYKGFKIRFGLHIGTYEQHPAGWIDGNSVPPFPPFDECIGADIALTQRIEASGKQCKVKIIASDEFLNSLDKKRYRAIDFKNLGKNIGRLIELPFGRTVAVEYKHLSRKKPFDEAEVLNPPALFGLDLLLTYMIRKYKGQSKTGKHQFLKQFSLDYNIILTKDEKKNFIKIVDSEPRKNDEKK